MLEDTLGNKHKKIKFDFHKYSTYIVISILLGIGLEFRLFDMLFDKPIQLVNQSLNLSSNRLIDNSLVFSTSAAILTTVFSIIFVLLTVFIQSSDVYNSAGILKDKETTNLIRLYFVTIVLSLMMLETTFQLPVLVLTLTFVCILSLYPFLHNLNDKLVYEVGVGKLHKEISSLIDSNDEYFTDIKANSLFVIGKKCIKDEKQDTFNDIIYIFDISTKKAEKQNMIGIVESTGNYYSLFLGLLLEDASITDKKRAMIKSLCQHIHSYVGNYSGKLKCEELDMQTDVLKIYGMHMIKADFNDRYVNQIADILLNMFYAIQKKRNMEEEGEIWCLDYKLEPNIIECIGELASTLYNRESEPSSLNNSVERCFAIGAKSCQAFNNFKHSGSFAFLKVTEELKKMENLIGDEAIEELFKNLKKSKKYTYSEPEFETYLDMFKAYYDSHKDLC